MTTTSEILRNAAEAIKAIGFTKKEYVTCDDNDEPCGLCSIGAVRVAAGGWTPETANDFDVLGASCFYSDAGERAEMALESALRELEPDRQAFYIPWWNDAEERTQAEVLALFERAAERAQLAGD